MYAPKDFALEALFLLSLFVLISPFLELHGLAYFIGKLGLEGPLFRSHY